MILGFGICDSGCLGCRAYAVVGGVLGGVWGSGAKFHPTPAPRAPYNMTCKCISIYSYSARFPKISKYLDH